MRVRIGEGPVFELSGGRYASESATDDTIELTMETGLSWARELRRRADDEYVRRREGALRCAAGRCGLPGQHPLNYPCGTD